MKTNKSFLLALGLLIIVGSVCRVLGYAPQYAMAIFGAVVIRDKRFAFVLPLASMLLSDVLYEVLYHYGYALYGGFYQGQITNYLLFALITLIGFWARGKNWGRIVIAAFAAPSIYFLISNFLVWLGGGGLQRPKTFTGLLMCYNDAIPFFRIALINSIVFSAILFGGYYLLQRYLLPRKQIA